MDGPAIRRELKALLENAMYRVSAAGRFGRIPEQVEREQPELVILDVDLPGASWFGICTQICGQTEIPVIFLASRTAACAENGRMAKGLTTVKDKQGKFQIEGAACLCYTLGQNWLFF